MGRSFSDPRGRTGSGVGRPSGRRTARSTSGGFGGVPTYTQPPPLTPYQAGTPEYSTWLSGGDPRFRPPTAREMRNIGRGIDPTSMSNALTEELVGSYPATGAGAPIEPYSLGYLPPGEQREFDLHSKNIWTMPFSVVTEEQARAAKIAMDEAIGRITEEGPLISILDPEAGPYGRGGVYTEAQDALRGTLRGGPFAERQRVIAPTIEAPIIDPLAFQTPDRVEAPTFERPSRVEAPRVTAPHVRVPERLTPPTVTDPTQYTTPEFDIPQIGAQEEMAPMDPLEFIDPDKFFRMSVLDPMLRDFQEKILPAVSRQYAGQFAGSERAAADTAARQDLLRALTEEYGNLGMQSHERMMDIAQENRLREMGVAEHNLASLLGVGELDLGAALGEAELGLEGLLGTRGQALESLLGTGELNLESLLGVEGLNLESLLGVEGLNLEGLLGAEGLNIEALLGAEGLNLEGLIETGRLDLEGLLGAEGLNIEALLGTEGLNLESFLGAEGLNLEGLLGAGELNLEGFLGAEGLNLEALTGLAETQLGALGLSGREMDRAVQESLGMLELLMPIIQMQLIENMFAGKGVTTD